MSMFDEIPVTGEALLSLIPQRMPIVMIDCFYGADEFFSYSALTVASDNIFCENGRLAEPGLIEHIAQSAAARVGYICLKQQKNVPEGYIGEIKKMRFNRLPLIGETLKTTIEITHDFGNIAVITAQIEVEGEPVAAGEMKIFLNTR